MHIVRIHCHNACYFHCSTRAPGFWRASGLRAQHTQAFITWQCHACVYKAAARSRSRSRLPACLPAWRALQYSSSVQLIARRERLAFGALQAYARNTHKPTWLHYIAVPCLCLQGSSTLALAPACLESIITQQFSIAQCSTRAPGFWRASGLRAQHTQAYLASLHGSATLVFTRQQHARARACLPGEHYNTVAQYSSVQLSNAILCRYKYALNKSVNCQRSYLDENTSTHSTTEVKHRWARIVLGWVTAWELLVALTFYFLCEYLHSTLKYFNKTYVCMYVCITAHYITLHYITVSYCNVKKFLVTYTLCAHASIYIVIIKLS